jgi:hypothetical protein
MSFFSGTVGSGIDFKATLAAGVTAAGIDYGLYNERPNEAMKDGLNHAGANIVAQVTNIGQFIPVPGELASISTDIAAGAAYCLINKFNTTSPFGENCLSNFLFGTANSILSYNVTERVFTSI